MSHWKISLKGCCSLDSRFNVNIPGVYTINELNARILKHTATLPLEEEVGLHLIQRRLDGKLNCDRDWVDCEDGFGDLHGEFWYGLSAIYCLANKGKLQVWFVSLMQME